MPEFQKISMEEARARTATGKRAQALKEYVEFIQRLGPTEAGRLRPAQDESTTALRRRINSAAKLCGVGIVSRRVGDEVVFWRQEQPAQAAPRRRGRRPRAS